MAKIKKVKGFYINQPLFTAVQNSVKIFEFVFELSYEVNQGT